MPESVRVLLVGAGPVGSLLAAALAENGAHFDWHVRSAERRSELAKGFAFQRGNEESQGQFVQPDAYSLNTELQEPESYDLLLLAVRGNQAAAMLEELRERVPVNRLLLVANGLQQGPCQLGLLYGGAYLQGATLFGGEHSRLLWGPLDTDSLCTVPVSRLLCTQWLEAASWPQMDVIMWHKLCLNCVINPLTALLGCRNGELLPFAESPLARSVLQECCDVAAKELQERWRISLDKLQAGLITLISDTATNTSSMLRDIKDRRETEIHVLNAAVAAAGRRFDLPCPFNEALSASIIALANKPGL